MRRRLGSGLTTSLGWLCTPVCPARASSPIPALLRSSQTRPSTPEQSKPLPRPSSAVASAAVCG